jgi:putative DNA primase/helicase
MPDGLDRVREVMLKPEDQDMGGVPPAGGGFGGQEGCGPESPVELPPDDEVTEDAIARRFTARKAETRRFDHTSGRWFWWTGYRWAPDETGGVLSELRQLARAATEGAKGSKLERARKAAFAGGAERFARCDPAHAVTAKVWDRDDWLMGTPGGTVDLRLAKIIHPDPADGITRMTAIAPNLMAGCPQWLAFLDDATGGDEDLIRFLQGWCGYCLTGSTREHALLFLYGQGGNGKSLFLNTVSHCLGDYATAAGMAVFQKGSENRHPTELASLAGARFVTSSETDEGKAWDEARLKQLTGGDPIRARFMRMDEFEFLPRFKLAIAGNRAPTIRNVDPAMRRRLCVVPFTRKPSNPDPDLGEKLKAEAPGILAWMMRGCLDWIENGLIRPASVMAATEEYFEAQDVLGGWLAQETEPDPKAWATSKALFESWTAYARSAGEEPGTAKWLGENLARRGFERKTSWVSGSAGETGKAVKGWAGIRIKGGFNDGDF